MSSTTIESNSNKITCDLLAQLRLVVRNANRADLRSVPALVGKMIVNQNQP